jgi:actin-related protein 5
MPAATTDIVANSGRNSPKPEAAKLWYLNEPPYEGIKPVDHEGYKKSRSSDSIVIDFGKYLIYLK